MKTILVASFLALFASIVAICDATAQTDSNHRYALVIHGGASSLPGRLPEKEQKLYRDALRNALTLGRDHLAKGGTSLDAVELVIRNLEDNPRFNAGKGAVFNSVGKHELDASIMDGKTLQCGGVAGVRTVRNPISLARLVMTKTPHVLLATDGAEKFADEMKVTRVEQKYFWTRQRYESWQKAKQAADRQKEESALPKKMGTVGCVALDHRGNLAAGTSTGGLSNKKYGRVGDSPIISAGTYANNATCGVSCTGVGEQFIRHAVAYDVSARIAYQGLSLADAVKKNLHNDKKKIQGGIIAIDRKGTIVMDYNTGGMFRGAADSSGRFEIGLK